MITHFNTVSPSFKGICSIGRDNIEKTIIANELLKSSRYNRDAYKKARVLKEAAQEIAGFSPENARLYIDYSQYCYPYGVYSHMPYHNFLTVYLKEDKEEYKPVAVVDFDTASNIENLRHVELSAKKIIDETKEYFKSGDTDIAYVPSKTSDSKDVVSVLNILG